jgi:4-carboxymuconolactone decarboxylase
MADTQDQKYDRGNKLRMETLGPAGQTRKELFDSFDEDLMRYSITFVFGDILSRPGLDAKTRELITLALAIGLGRAREIRSHTRGFLNNGGTKKELVELLLQVAAYAGFPAMVEGAYGVIEVFEERGLMPPSSKASATGG